MNLRRQLEDWQVRWAVRRGVRVGSPPGHPGSRATGYVSQYVSHLHENLFEPLSKRVKQQFITGAGGELLPPGGESGHMYAVYSSSALCVNLFHPWSRLLDDAQPEMECSINPLLSALGLAAVTAKRIDFEVPKTVNPRFTTAPHLDVQVSFENSHCTCAAIESKFCEPYGGKKSRGLDPCYLWERELWKDWPNIRELAEKISPDDQAHSHLHAAQLIIDLLGLRKQNGMGFVLAYLWFHVPNAEAAIEHRREIESFAEVLKRDGVAFVSRTYQQVFESFCEQNREAENPHLAYLLERYITAAPGGAVSY